ncbi:HAUS augmin-like complex subunit 7 isoform X1 [Sorex araneus]|uniref:HAUS augmin-like complex subunit 7 isoform X1 n=1 Tax=Sorex araneus TaxID=42254 RepID=UPI00243405E1|nr:HAUS augmin-like complex subunit 7 isoform X1 [Sorex araneus]
MGGALPGARNMAGLGTGGGSGGGDKNESSIFDAAVEVYGKLKDLKCPFLQGLYITEPATIQELLCTPSKYRLEILEWMYIRVYPFWKDKLTVLKGVPVEVKIQEMVKLGSDLLLCGPRDDELLQGRDCAQKQLHFMDQLLTVGQSLASTGASCPSAEEHLEDISEKNEVLLGSVLSPSYLPWLLSPSCDPWPLDVQPLLCGLYDSGQELPQLHSPPLPGPGADVSVQLEQDEVEKLATQLHGRVLMLEVLRTQCLEQHQLDECVTWTNANTLDQTLHLVTSDFYQLVLAFLQVCEHELAECSQRPRPLLHPCGPIIQAVDQVLTLYGQLLKVVVEVTSTSGQTTEPLCQASNSPVVSLASKMEEFLEKCKVFGDTLDRHTDNWGQAFQGLGKAGTERGTAAGK